MNHKAHISLTRFFLATTLLAYLLLNFSAPLIYAQTASRSASVASDSASASQSAIIDQIANAPKSRGMNVTLSPVFLNLTAYAGKTSRAFVKITNNNAFAEVYKLAVIRFRPDASGQSIIPVDSESQDESLQWVKLEKSQVVIQPGATEIVNFEVKAPEYAFLGYYFGISVKRIKEQFARTDTTKVVGQAVMPILLEVRQEGKEGKLFVDSGEGIYKQAEIVKFNTTSWWYEYLPSEFEVHIKNTGRVHLPPFGDIIIQQGQNELGSVPINQSGGNILPGATRTYTSSWSDGFIVREPVKEGSSFVLDKNGKKTYKTVIHWDSLPKMRIGRYSAKAIVVYNNGRNDVPLEAEVSFWIIPWKIILVIALVLAVVIFSIKNTIKGLLGR